MFPVEKAPRYVEETRAATARLQEQTTPGQYAALVGRAERLIDGLFWVDVQLDRDLMIRIALRERFVPERVERAVLLVATHRLIADLAESWGGRKAARPVKTAMEPAVAV